MIAAAPADPIQPPAVDYRPGVCNIGPAEIARRRRSGHIGVVLTLVTLAVLVAIDAPDAARLLVGLPAAMAATGYLQAWFKFCVAFGSAGVFNFDAIGGTERIADPAARSRDRARALRIGLLAAGVGVAIAVVSFAVPL